MTGDDLGASFPDDERSIELESLTAIFPEIMRDPGDPFTAFIEIPVAAAKPFALPTPESAPGRCAGEPPPPQPPQQQQHMLTYLPPLSLRFSLPLGYPDEKPPCFELGTGQPSWLPAQIARRLVDDGKRMWEDLGRGPIVYDFIDQLIHEAEAVFNLVSDDGVARLDTPPNVSLALLDFDAKMRRKVFEQETFECGVCLTPKKGSSCYRFPRCRHVFCVECLQDFYNACITEGDINSVKCLEPSCGKTNADEQPNGASSRRKEDHTLTANELLEIPLEQATVQRYVELKRKAELELDKNVVYCPRSWCQGPARYTRARSRDGAGSPDEGEHAGGETREWKAGDSEDKLPPRSERLAICQDCSYAFCRVCMTGWHGEFAVCWPRRPAELSAEEQATAEYLRRYSSACPTCDAPCQKTIGCNHMVCFRCKTHFCYLCRGWLADDNPYKHFNTPNSSCYGLLWVLEQGDGLDVPVRRPEDFFEHEDDEIVDDGHINNNNDPAPAADPAAPPAPLPAAPPAAPPAAAPAPAAPLAVPLAVPPAAGGGRQPPAPAPGRGRGRGRGQNPPRAQGRGRGRAAAPAAPAAEPVRAAAGGPGRGLNRFLQMVDNDEEDEWDSDELDSDIEDDFDGWAIPDRGRRAG